MDMGIRKSNSDTFDGVCLKAKEYLSLRFPSPTVLRVILASEHKILAMSCTLRFAYVYSENIYFCLICQFSSTILRLVPFWKYYIVC